MSANGSEAGSTLIEALAALFLTTLLLSSLMNFYWICNKAFIQQSASSDAQYACRSAMLQIGEDVRAARQVPVVQESNSKLLLLQSGGNVYYYRNEDNNNLYRSAGGTNIPIAENIRYLSFCVSGNLLITTIEATFNGQSYRLSSAVSTRMITVP